MTRTISTTEPTEITEREILKLLCDLCDLCGRYLYRSDFKIWFLATRKLPRLKDKKRPNIIILDRFLSFNPGALAQPKIQILRPLRYTRSLQTNEITSVYLLGEKNSNQGLL